MIAKGIVGAGALGVTVLLLFLLGAFSGGTVYVTGTRAGNLDGGSEGGVQVPMKRGGSEMIGDAAVKNVGKSPILIESIEPQSNSPELRATRGRLWYLPRNVNRIVMVPMWWPGWPPKGPIDRPKTKPSWRTPTPDYFSLPTKGEIRPGAEDQLVYGIFLHADPSPKIRVTALQITFKQSGRTFVWTLPEEVRVDYHSHSHA